MFSASFCEPMPVHVSEEDGETEKPLRKHDAPMGNPGRLAVAVYFLCSLSLVNLFDSGRVSGPRSMGEQTQW